jgi:hypothetical protein
VQVEDPELDAEEREAAKAERMGLTPDWIIQAGALLPDQAPCHGDSSRMAVH